MSAVEKLLAGDFPSVGPEEKKLLESFFLDYIRDTSANGEDNFLERMFMAYAKEMSTDGGKTAWLPGGLFIFNEVLTPPKKKRQ